MRNARAPATNTLGMPTLILPSLQVNMRAGAHAAGRGRACTQVFLQLPLNAL